MTRIEQELQKVRNKLHAIAIEKASIEERLWDLANKQAELACEETILMAKAAKAKATAVKYGLLSDVASTGFDPSNLKKVLGKGKLKIKIAR